MGSLEEEDYDTSLNYITNELLQKYDEKFNNLYRKIVNTNSSIMNKEELIYKENEEIQYKNNTINILQYTIVFIILFGILLIMYGKRMISLSALAFYIMILFIIYLLVIYFTIYSNFTKLNMGKYINSISVDMASFYDKNIESRSGYTCPATCPPVVPPSASSYPLISTYQTPTLNIDPQTNVWKYGDIPSDLYTTPTTPATNFYSSPIGIPNYGPSAENEAQPFFGTTYPATTYYKCEWLGGQNPGSSGLPNNEANQYTTIPCTFRQNFQEVGRYICNSDPNTNPSGINSCEPVTN